MLNEMKLIMQEYYHVIGLTPEKTRRAEQVKARAAMMSAMRHFNLTTTSIGEVFEADHSTVVHHTAKHDGNMEYWPGYRKNYISAARLCNYTMRTKIIQSKLRYVNAQLTRLNRLKKDLEETIK
tara:strand:+ start:682 stop:1053 length:372 start_codon:yes stop_codon:yes gene_type:complete